VIATITLAVGVLAVISALAAVVMRLVASRRARTGSAQDLGAVSQQWLNGHRSESL
jgi:hypothetical protein